MTRRLVAAVLAAVTALAVTAAPIVAQRVSQPTSVLANECDWCSPGK